MQGDMGKALRILSIAKGWDPTVIQGTGESIANFDKEPSGVDHVTVGRLPQGTPDSFAEDHPGVGSPESVPFAAPDRGTGTDAQRRTSNADPFVGGITGG